jgi:hypothetical protein
LGGNGEVTLSINFSLKYLQWLKKQADARRKSGFVDADLRPEERDPLWLLEKGKYDENTYLKRLC